MYIILYMSHIATSKLLQEDDIHDTDEGLVFNPFNSNNKEIRLSEVQSILKRYGLPGDVVNLNLYHST